MFGKLAETINNYVKKGDKLGVSGRLQVRNYDNSEGKKVYVTEVIVDSVDFLESKKKDNNDNNLNKEVDPFQEITDDMLPW